MQNLELEAETIQISIYTNIVLNILQKHKELSLNKMIFFSYLIKKENFRFGKIYSANNKKDIVYKAISLLSGEYIEYCDNIKFILKAIHLLIEKKKIELNGHILYWISDNKSKKSLYQESLFIEKAIEESKKISDRQFMKEVTANV